MRKLPNWQYLDVEIGWFTPQWIVYRQRSGHLVSPLVSHWENLQLGYFGNTNESRIFRKLYDIVDNMTL